MKATDELKDLKSKNIADLGKLLHQKKDELIKINLDTQFGKNKDVASIGKLKKSIARIETTINELITTQASKNDEVRKND
jgi:ribosomal protein L29